MPANASFAHGVHPPDCKEDTRALPIRQFPFAPVLTVPLSQHLGRPAIACVREGQEVTRGQRIGEADGRMSVAMHAPASGTVRRIGLVPSSKGSMVPGVFLEPWPASTQELCQGTPCPVDAPREQILDAIQQAGVVGLGGAAFPTHVKLAIGPEHPVDTLILNGAECEPYLTTDHRVMLEQDQDLFMGVRYLLRTTGAERAIIGIEANKQDAAEHLRARVPQDMPLTVEVMPVKYPQGAEKMLITALLGREVPRGRLPFHVGCVVVNVATCAEIGRLLPIGGGIQERVITIGGPAVRDKGNYRIPIGTPLRFLLETVGVDEALTSVFLGGPMMGRAVADLDISVTKGTSGVIAFTERETGPVRQRAVHPCIRCGYCLDACPIFLNPSELGLLAKAGLYERMAEEHALMDCFECGSCSFVCPSHIGLVQHFRIAKQALRRAKAS